MVEEGTQGEVAELGTKMDAIGLCPLFISPLYRRTR
jgi:hypothetical protein